jgi:chromosome partitioning protein
MSAGQQASQPGSKSASKPASQEALLHVSLRSWYADDGVKEGLSPTRRIVIYALTNSKGGVGKSTLAVHLAVWLEEQGNRVALVDADVQSSSSVWLHEASPATPGFRLQTPDDILEQVPQLVGQFDHLVIDGPAGLSEVTRTILFVADVTLLPCGPSVLDLRAAQDAIRVVRQAQGIRKGPPHAVLVPNKLQIQYRLSQELLHTAQSLDVPASSGLRLRQAYADAAGQGKVVWRMGSRAEEAAREIQVLFRELMGVERGATTIDERRIANS